MATTTKSLGRGIDALFRNNPQNQLIADGEIHTLAIDTLIPNPDQPRRHFHKESMDDLVASIKAQGIVQPLLVRPKGAGTYEIVAGERRWRAAKLAGLTKLPVLVRNLNDDEVMAAALIENLQREDLNPIEEALAINALRERYEITQEDLATRIGKSRPAIANILRLLNLSLAAQDDLQFARLTQGHARCLLGINNEEAAEELRQAILNRQFTVRETEAALNFWKENKTFPWQVENAPEETHIPVVTEKPQSNRKKPEVLKKLQKILNKELDIRTAISGTEDKGRITFAYDNPKQLCDFLRRIQIEMP